MKKIYSRMQFCVVELQAADVLTYSNETNEIVQGDIWYSGI